MLEAVKRHCRDADRLRVLHLPAGFRRDIDKLYRVDAKAGALIVRADVSVEALNARRLNTIGTGQQRSDPASDRTSMGNE